MVWNVDGRFVVDVTFVFGERSDDFALSLTSPFPFSPVVIMGGSPMLLIDAVCISSSRCAGVISGWMFSSEVGTVSMNPEEKASRSIPRSGITWMIGVCPLKPDGPNMSEMKGSWCEEVE